MTEAEQKALQDSCGTLANLLGDAIKRGIISPHRVTPQWLRAAQTAVAEAEALLGKKRTVPGDRMIYGPKDPPASEHWGRSPL
jgi:hypothetical protein